LLAIQPSPKPKERANMDNCIYCGETVYDDDEKVCKSFGVAHIECSETEDPNELD